MLPASRWRSWWRFWWRRATRVRPRWTLAGRMLALQLAIMAVVLVGVAAVSVAQSSARFRETEGRQALAVAENLAGVPGIRAAAAARGREYLSLAQAAVQSGRTFSRSTTVALALPDGRVIASTDPLPATSARYLRRTEAFDGRGWVGTDAGTGAALAMAPVINVQNRQTDGVVAVYRQYPTVWDSLQQALPNVLTYLGIAGALGILGSLLLARRVKRQTLGLEPREIAGLVEQREALLHGIREGVLAVDLRGRITLVNDEAAHLLGIPQMSTGSRLDDLDDTGQLAQVFEQAAPATDRVAAFRGRVISLNRMPVLSRGRHIGWVATLRDRTELLELQRELDLTRNTTDTLRAQAHEFSNRMHVISGLIELEEYADVRSYIQRVAADQTELSRSVISRVADPAVAALIMAKSSQAAERGTMLLIEPSTQLDRLDEQLATDVTSVLGNLVDNALDAAGSGPESFVEVELAEVDGVVRVTVRDSGPGVDPAVGDRVFAHGFSTKDDESGGQRGIGLALARLICRKRGGDVTVRNDGGAVFVATLPARVSAPAR